MLLFQVNRLRMRRIRPILKELRNYRDLMDSIASRRALLLIHDAVFFVRRKALNSTEGLAKGWESGDDVCEQFCWIGELLARENLQKVKEALSCDDYYCLIKSIYNRR